MRVIKKIRHWGHQLKDYAALLLVFVLAFRLALPIVAVYRNFSVVQVKTASQTGVYTIGDAFDGASVFGTIDDGDTIKKFHFTPLEKQFTMDDIRVAEGVGPEVKVQITKIQCYNFPVWGMMLWIGFCILAQYLLTYLFAWCISGCMVAITEKVVGCSRYPERL